ncbi:MAG: hypothetical protein AAFV72_21775 [Cyanobacteria bacterium J06635_1]
MQLDDLADYSEFIFKVKEIRGVRSHSLVQYECHSMTGKLICRPLPELAQVASI